jgi:hypothetical protein
MTKTEFKWRENDPIKNPPQRSIAKTDSVVDSIIDQFVSRASFGKQKYGTDLDREDLSVLEWIEHAKQEHMDAILYLEKLKKIVETKGL